MLTPRQTDALIKMLAVPVGAGLGWVGGKAFEAAGAALLKNANEVEAAANEKLRGKREHYVATRRRLLAKIQTFSSLIALQIGRLPNTTIRPADTLPDYLETMWSKITSLSTAAQFPVVGVTTTTVSKRDTNMRLSYAMQTSQRGNPAAGALGAGAIVAAKGFEYGAQCVSYWNDIRKSADESDGKAAAAQRALDNDIVRIEKEWEEVITPKLVRATSAPYDIETLAGLLKWSEMVERMAGEAI